MKDELLKLAEKCEAAAEKALDEVVNGNLAPEWRAEVACRAAGELQAAASLRARAQGAG